MDGAEANGKWKFIILSRNYLEEDKAARIGLLIEERFSTRWRNRGGI